MDESEHDEYADGAVEGAFDPLSNEGKQSPRMALAPEICDWISTFTVSRRVYVLLNLK